MMERERTITILRKKEAIVLNASTLDFAKPPVNSTRVVQLRVVQIVVNVEFLDGLTLERLEERFVEVTATVMLLHHRVTLGVKIKPFSIGIDVVEFQIDLRTESLPRHTRQNTICEFVVSEEELADRGFCGTGIDHMCIRVVRPNGSRLTCAAKRMLIVKTSTNTIND